jgi:hypothetical protein
VKRVDDPSASEGARDELVAPLPPDEAARWLEAVRAAWSPSELSPTRHEQLLRDALEDPFAEASAEEEREAQALREALEHGGEHEHAALARALAHALGASSVEPGAEKRALERALDLPPARSNLILVAFGVAATGLALAASIALVVGSTRRPEAALARRELAPSRSLAPLLNADAARLSASERIDRVASVRARELRDNRYAAWGVR